MENPRRPVEPNPLFPFSDEVKIVKGKKTAEQKQRELDGTPLTRSGPRAWSPPQPTLYVKDAKVEKSVGTAPIDPSEEIKKFLDE